MPTNDSIKDGEDKPVPYLKAIEHLSGLDFETTALIDDEVPPSVVISVSTVAVVYQKSVAEVLEDLTEKRLQEAEDVRVDNELRYGHLNQDGSNPHEGD